MPLRIVFMGTPEFSVPSMVELIGHGHEVVACYSQPPRPAGRRGLELKQSPVHAMAESFGIPVFTPLNFKAPEDVEQFRALEADIAIVIAYGLILPRAILEAPRLGCYNGHASLLPRWRGAAPIQRAIMAGDEKTGVNIMKMDEGLDTGPVALGEALAITAEMTAEELHDQLSKLTADLMVCAVSALKRGSLELVPQSDEGVTYAEKISKEETRVDWSKSATDVHNHIRGLSPFPGAWCEMQLAGKSQRVKLLGSRQAGGSGPPGTILDGLKIACGEGAVEITKLQRAGKQVQSGDEFLRGNYIEEIL